MRYVLIQLADYINNNVDSVIFSNNLDALQQEHEKITQEWEKENEQNDLEFGSGSEWNTDNWFYIVDLIEKEILVGNTNNSYILDLIEELPSYHVDYIW